MSKLISRFAFGDMQALFFTDSRKGNAELLLLPADTEYSDKDIDEAHDHVDSVVQIKITGDTYTGGYAPGVSMRMDTGACPFKFAGQDVLEEDDVTAVITRLSDERGYVAEHHLKYRKGEKVLKSYSIFRNESESDADLELLSSFSLGKISPLMKGDGYGTLKLSRIRSVWSMEGRKEVIPLEDLQLEPSWTGHAVRCERFGAVGSYAVNKFFPYMVVEDSKNHLFWGASIAHNASWQMELYRRGTEVQMSGGLADRETGHWLKTVHPGEEFKTPEAFLSVCAGEDGEEIWRRLTSAMEDPAEHGPESEQTLPVLFNEYCTTWGNPSHDNICEILESIKDKGFEYFVIDCGWYKRPEVPWDVSMGDYNVSQELFPQGIGKTVSKIREAGMKPGIWFEIDNTGSRSEAYKDSEHLLKRDGKVLTTTMRRFWDLRQTYVQDLLTERVIGLLKKYGFEYLKIDCNDTIGIGCDGAESLGEGLRQNQAASAAFVDKIKSEIPGIIIENCASGGHRIEPLMMSKCAMASFSDAHECEEIPIIAANLHRVMLPRQSQIWAVIRKDDSLKRVTYSVANTFLGRMCISGDVWMLSSEQWQLLDRGIAFYKRIAPVIKNGKTFYHGSKIISYRHPEGWQGILREGEDSAYLLLHGFNDIRDKEISIRIPEYYHIGEIYSYKEESVTFEKGMLNYTFDEDMKAVCIFFEKRI
ncbi:MAG: alpha-galactosidase [Lachnospiraceae bacterium]|nr:alpha-galactosidase [Lachnospiraceae bacterium]